MASLWLAMLKIDGGRGGEEAREEVRRLVKMLL